MKLIGEGAALASFYSALGAVESVRKTETADMGKYQVRYASLNAVHAECSRACELFKLAVFQEPTQLDGLFAVRTSLIHEDGSILEFDPMCLPMPREAQALGSATTYLRRYSLVALFALAVEDDDGRAATVGATTQPGRRTEAERLIRESLGTMDEAMRARFQVDFKQQFGQGLTDLPSSRHGDALTWSREWQREREAEALAAQAEADAADAEFVKAASEPAS